MSTSNTTTSHEAAFDVLKTLNTDAEALRSGDQKARDAMIADCFALIAKLETPEETFVRNMWNSVSILPVSRSMSDRRPFTGHASCDMAGC